VRNEGGTNVAHTDTFDLPLQKFEGDGFLIGDWSMTFHVTQPASGGQDLAHDLGWRKLQPLLARFAARVSMTAMGGGRVKTRFAAGVIRLCGSGLPCVWCLTSFQRFPAAALPLTLESASRCKSAWFTGRCTAHEPRLPRRWLETSRKGHLTDLVSISANSDAIRRGIPI
jgi:hypothetical protein